MSDIQTTIQNIGVIPVIKIDASEDALPLGKALLAGGLPVAEVTFRTAAGEKAIQILRKELPEILVGAGTITSVADAKRAIDAGATFIVSPGYSAEVVEYCQKQAIPIYPGVNNASQIQLALQQGLSVVKFFPAEASGGVTMLNALSAPFPTMRFIPTGGIGVHNMATYLRKPYTLACGGSWMVKSELITQKRWEEITQLSREAVIAVHGFTFAHVGVSAENNTEATKLAHLFGAFLQPVSEGKTAFFTSDFLEVTKQPSLGTHGHIGIQTWDIERALPYLEQHGFSVNTASARYDAQGKLTLIYFQEEVGGFALHLVRK